MSDSSRFRATRRRTVCGAGSGLVGLLAGCASLTDGKESSDPSYDQLQRTAVYVAEGVDLSMPDEVPTVRAAENADLLVLPGDTDTDASQAVDWLAADRVLALLGSAAEATWLDWAQSEPFTDTFEPGGYADGEPDPVLLVAAKIGLNVPTYRHSWGGSPRDRDLLRALDEDLAAIASRTP